MFMTIFKTFIQSCTLALINCLVSISACHAHPHVSVQAQSELVYDASANLTGVRHHWTFDESFSTFAVQGLDSKKDGKYTREDLADLAKTNVESLSEFGYFSSGKSSGKKLEFNDPKDQWLEFTNKKLTLHFFLPLKAPISGRTVTFEVYDPTYYVDFSFIEANPVTLSGAPAACTVTIKKPPQLDTAKSKNLSEDFFAQMSASSNYGAGFATHALVVCP
jgi:ABC-type uncharacterized transport system substrate-binding protein